MTDDRIWEQSSVAERCEILRRRMEEHSMREKIDAWSKEHWARARSYLDAERLRRIEEKLTSGREACGEQIERWKRIEKAAKDIVSAADRDAYLIEMHRRMDELKEALK